MAAALAYIAVHPMKSAAADEVLPSAPPVAAAEEVLPSPPRATAEELLPPPPATAAEEVLLSPPRAAAAEVLLLPSRWLSQLKHRQALRPPQSGLWLAQSRSWHARVQYRTLRQPRHVRVMSGAPHDTHIPGSSSIAHLPSTFRASMASAQPRVAADFMNALARSMSLGRPYMPCM